MRIKQKLLSVLLALCIVLAFVPTMALAAPDDAVTIYLSGTGGSDSADGTAPEKAVKTLSKAKELVGEGGAIVITGGLVLKDAGSIDLSGVTVQRGENYANTLFILQGNTTMTLSNVTLDGGNIATKNNLILVENGAELNIGEGAKLCNNAATALKVYASKGSSATVNMTGGEISENTDSRGNKAGAVDVGNYGVFNMSGGTIRDNYTNSDGGGVQVAGDGKFYMSGGFIEENECDYGGGGIGNYGYVEITGGEVRNNSAGYGGGLAAFYDNTGTILDGGSITGNEAIADDEVSGNGGGVFLNNPSVFTMKSGSITDNKADGWGGGIYSWEDADFGTAIIQIQGGTISGNTVGEGGLGDAVAVGGDSSNGEDTARLELSGSPTISGAVLMDERFLETTKAAIVGSFIPVQPVMLDDVLWNDNRVFVTYAEGLTPNTSDFQFADEQWGPLVEGQNIVRVGMRIVNIWVETTKEYKSFYTLPGSPIDQSKIPVEAVTKVGYSVSGWERKKDGSSLGLWDIQTPVTEDLLLHPVWKLNPAAVTLTATNDGKVHTVNGKATLTAEASHAADGVAYSWKWYKDGALIEGNNKEQLVITEAGVYKVVVTASDGNQTSDPVEKSITIAEEGHIFPDKWKSDESNHWHECTACPEKGDISAHTFEWVVDKETTTTEAGSKHEECSVCGYEKAAVEIPATGTTEPTDPSGPTDPDKEDPGEGTGSPQTGDSSHLFVWILLAILSSGAVFTLTLKGKREANQ